MPKEPRNVGLIDGKFYPCPEKQVCVSTQSPKDDEVHYIEPLTYESNLSEAKKKIIDIIKSQKRTRILENQDSYIRAVFTTFLFRFKDDVEFLFDDTNKIIHFRSQSRIGGFDWGTNRKRMEMIKKRYNEMD